MGVNSYALGSQVQVSATFSVGGVNTDPGAVTLKVLPPSGKQATQATTRSAAGVYAATLSVTQSGLWKYRFEGTTPAIGASEGEFFVALSPFK